MNQSLVLPELGEGIERGTVISISVQPGAWVKAGQALFDVEADKVSVEIPAILEGELVELFVAPGDEVAVGERLATIRTDGREREGPDAGIIPAVETRRTPAQPDSVRTDSRFPRLQTGRDLPAGRHAGYPAPAGPAARRTARELGIDIRAVPGSGKRGRICRRDVLAYGARLLRGGGETGTSTTPLPDLARFGGVEQIPMDSIQRATARNMARAWREIPHAWLERRMEITALERLRRLGSLEGERAPTLTAYLLKALAHTMAAYPVFNASIDTANGYVVQRRYLDIGVAVDSPRGLLVPVMRGVLARSVDEVDAELRRLTTEARAGRLAAEAFQGAGMTLSNLGGMGVDAIFPLINWPQSAILGVASARRQGVREAAPGRLLLPVTMAIDHRLINGADGVRFLQHLEALLQRPQEIA